MNRTLRCYLPFGAMAALMFTRAQDHNHGTIPVLPSAATTWAGAQPVKSLPNISAFSEALTILPNAVPARTNGTTLEYDIYMRAGSKQFHPGLPAVPIWGYTDAPTGPGLTPGPVIQATVNSPITVRWIDELPTTYPPWIPADIRNHGVTDQKVRNVVHLHGGATRPLFDGHPTDWFLPGVTTNYFYDNIDLSAGEDGETLWYHDHALGVTANNVYAGLSGMYLLRNPQYEKTLSLPADEYEVPLIFQDRDVQMDIDPPSLISDLASTNVVPWHYLPVVNGQVAPHLDVEPRRYRFRMLNGCSFRTIGLALVTQTNAATGPVKANVPMYQIGTDDGFLARAVAIPSTNSTPPYSLPTLRLMPGERADVIIDFTQWIGSDIVMTNAIDTGDASAPPFAPVNVLGKAFLQFRVTKSLKARDATRDVSTNPVLRSTDTTAQQLAARAVKTRRVTLDLSGELPNPGLAFARDPHLFALLNMSNFDAPVTERPRAGDIEIWEFANLTGASHPIHIHLLDFLILDRQSFTGWNGNPAHVPEGVANYIVDRQLGRLKDLNEYLDHTTNGNRFVQRNELGPKDVFHSAPGAVTRVVMQWPTNEIFFGLYVYHCHILDHEDNDMMRPLELRPPLPKNSLLTEIDRMDNAISIQLGTTVGEKGFDVIYQVEGSADLTTWQTLTNATGSGMTLYLREVLRAGANSASAGTGVPYRFYRAVVHR